MKSFLLPLAFISAIIPVLPALALPVTYYGQKGEYTVDYDAGTYKGCIYQTGCIVLGKNRKVGIATWKNGEYTYSINDEKVQVYKRGKVIFQDTFN
ncbi:hypothetical protein [Synechocystis sp. LKSZ1]|uniref:hypothetical protein n=1 Tax=Synechocystis sp. LKSZ1 TaxID=3144951 RepID=UPI00336BB404